MNTWLQDSNGALFLIYFVVDDRLQTLGDLGELGEPAVGLSRGRTRNNQRSPSLIDKNRVNLIDDCKKVAALNQVSFLPGHVVAQVIKTKLVVGAICNVRKVLLPALGWLLARKNTTGGHSKSSKDTAHKF